MLKVRGLYKSLENNKILHDITFSLQKNQITALLGVNGAGKTTLMRCIAGVYEPDAGSVCFAGTSIKKDRKKYLQNIAYVPEWGGLYPDMTVFEYLIFIAKLNGGCDKKLLAETISALELESVIDKKCAALSKGYKKRTALAAALLKKPKLLILDEPTEGLDPKQKIVLRKLLKKYAENNAILISTHIMEEVSALASHILIINKGQIICDAPLSDVEKTIPDGNFELLFYNLDGDKH